MNVNRLRSKWAAVGAAVAVTLGAGGIGITHATTSSGEMPIYIPIEPCRLADTRTDFQVGSRGTPLGADETYTLDGQGSVGNCNLPNGTTALSLNVTALDASAPTFVSLFPAGASLPVASHLNPLPGQGPTPNAVNVDLNGGGEFSIYNLAGTVNVIIDVVGVFDDHEHTGADIVDGSLTGADIEDETVTGDDIDNGTVSNADTSNEPGIAFDYQSTSVAATSEPGSIAATAIRVPSDGYVSIEVTGMWRNENEGAEDEVWCQLQKGSIGAINTSEPWFILDERGAATISRYTEFSAHRVMEIDLADNPLLFSTGQPINLVCDLISGTARFDDIQISATFFATSYKPAGLIVLPFGADGLAEAGSVD
ncbi:MAG: hypothetical protein R8G01_21940 [Ilumatobacteraceae bacterium]|nr:hypothetical protein [Ilumatobacteraceae bacterium]